MRGKSIFFFDPDGETGRAAERALHATGSAVQTCREFAPTLAALEAGAHDLYILNCDPPVVRDGRLLAMLDGAPKEPGKIVLLASGQTEDYMPVLAGRRFLGNLVARNEGPLEPEELITTAEKLLRRDIFGIDKYLRWGVEPYVVSIRDSQEKPAYVAEVVRYAGELGCNTRTIDLIESIADELISNAIFNAPRAPDGSSRYGKQSRKERVVLEPHEQAELSFACDGDFLALATVDPFGALNQELVVAYLNRCMIKGPNQLSESSGGAGLGLYRIFQSLSKFILNIAPGKKTEVLTLVDLRLSMKQFRLATKSFHVFVDRP